MWIVAALRHRWRLSSDAPCQCAVVEAPLFGEEFCWDLFNEAEAIASVEPRLRQQTTVNEFLEPPCDGVLGGMERCGEDFLVRTALRLTPAPVEREFRPKLLGPRRDVDAEYLSEEFDPEDLPILLLAHSGPPTEIVRVGRKC